MRRTGGEIEQTIISPVYTATPVVATACPSGQTKHGRCSLFISGSGSSRWSTWGALGFSSGMGIDRNPGSTVEQDDVVTAGIIRKDRSY